MYSIQPIWTDRNWKNLNNCAWCYMDDMKKKIITLTETLTSDVAKIVLWMVLLGTTVQLPIPCLPDDTKLNTQMCIHFIFVQQTLYIYICTYTIFQFTSFQLILQLNKLAIKLNTIAVIDVKGFCTALLNWQPVFRD